MIEDDGHSTLDLTYEEILVVELSRVSLVPSKVREVESLLDRNLNWTRVRQLIVRHELNGCVLEKCLDHGFQRLLCKDSSLAIRAEADRRQNIFLLFELTQIARALASTGLHVVVLKGPALINQVYGELGRRRFGDLDLMVTSDGVEKLENSLSRLGYLPTELDLRTGLWTPLNEKEVARPKGGLHRPPIMRPLRDSSFWGPVVEIHHPGLKVGFFDYNAILENSELASSLAPGIRVPTVLDLIIHCSYHFFRHYRLVVLTDVSNSFGAMLNRNTGALKFLRDIYACLKVYFENGGCWEQLDTRSRQLNSREILLYALHNLELVYGLDLPLDREMKRLSEPDIFEFPVVGTTVATTRLRDIIRSDIETLAGKIGPEWIFLRPQSVYHQVHGMTLQWRKSGGPWPSADVPKISRNLSAGEFPPSQDWRDIPQISLDEENVLPDQFFQTHISGGVLSSDTNISANANILWTDSTLFVRTVVKCAEIYYTDFGDEDSCGERVVIYISGFNVANGPIKRVGVSVGTGESATLHPLPDFSSGVCKDLILSSNALRMQQIKSGYSIEVGIPWQALNVAPSKGLAFGLDLEVVHQSRNRTLETVLAWAGGHLLSEASPVFHGTISLSEPDVDI